MARKPMEIKPWIGDPPPAEPPELPGYVVRERHSFPMAKGSLIGMATLPLWLIVFSLLFGLLGDSGVSFNLNLLNLALAVLIILVIVPLIHEAVHGLVAIATGHKPSFGIGPGFAYTTLHEPISKGQYIAIAIGPLLLMSIGGLALAALLPGWRVGIFFALVFNAMGAVGDLWMIWKASRAPAEALIVDLADGFAVYGPAPTEPEEATATAE